MHTPIGQQASYLARAETTAYCVVAAARRYELPPSIILAIMKTENGAVGQAIRDPNGTYDVGPMQINSSNFYLFRGYITPWQLRNNLCANIYAGAWILKDSINRAGSFWAGVGDYHSHTPARRIRYEQRVYRMLFRVRAEIRDSAMWHYDLETRR